MPKKSEGEPEPIMKTHQPIDEKASMKPGNSNGFGRFQVKPVTENGMREKGGQTLESSHVELFSADQDESNSSNQIATDTHLETLFPNEPKETPLLSSYFKGYVVPGPRNDKPGRKKANLGTLLGVYLPTIQHIFGVLMFLRLFWTVGLMGIAESFGMVFLCCTCTLLTSVSMSAIATNGVVESGGSYFMISRNLGPAIGTAIGFLFYIANAVATSMYLVGGVEILLMYMLPSAAVVGGHKALEDSSSLFGGLANNVRIYGTALLALEFVIVALGVRVVQLFAPVSLLCVILSILAIYAGGIEKSVRVGNRPMVCLANEVLLKREYYQMKNESDLFSCAGCQEFCCPANRSLRKENCAQDCKCVEAITGFKVDTFQMNSYKRYMNKGETRPGVKGRDSDVTQDIRTDFFVLLAIYFPSVTGIMTGSNMSGDLKDPQKSIPSGTIAAQLTTSFVYLSFTVLFGGTIRREVLWDKYGFSFGNTMVMSQLVWPHPYVLIIGSFTSTFGAALQCLCSAPRLLQSIAKDEVIPCIAVFSRVTRFNEPLYGLLLSTALSFLALMIGSLDHVAPIVDYCFLMCYAFVNLSCAFMSLLGVPSWRPRFRAYHWSLSLIGCLLCIFIMFATHWYYALGTIFIFIIIYIYVVWKGNKREWGDGMRGLYLTLAQLFLVQLEDREDMHVKNWRPQLLILTKPDRFRIRMKMLEIAHQLKAGKGLTILASILVGDALTQESRKRAAEVKENMRNEMVKAGVRGFVKAPFCLHRSHMPITFSTLMQSAGIGTLRPNTLMVGWPASWRNRDDDFFSFMDRMHRGGALDTCLLIPKEIADWPSKDDVLTGTIDIWWILRDGGVLILVGFLLQKSGVWKNCNLCLFVVAEEGDNCEEMQQAMEHFLYQVRIVGTVRVVKLARLDVSAYATLDVKVKEERKRVMKGQEKTLANLEPQLITKIHRLRSLRTEKSEIGGKTEPYRGFDSFAGEVNSSGSGSHSNYHYTFSNRDGSELLTQTKESGNGTSGKIGQEDDKVRVRIHSARHLNQTIVHNSGRSQLVIINLPQPPKSEDGMYNYMEYMEILTSGLKRVMLVRGSGKEVITIYS